MRVVVAAVIGLALAVSASAQQSSPQRAWVSVPGADKWSNGPPSQHLDANGSSFNWSSSSMMQVGPGRLMDLDPFGYNGAVDAVFRVVTPPTPVAGSPSFPGLAGLIAQYPLDASASFDADGDAIVQYTWSENGNVLATSAAPTATLMLSGGKRTTSR